MKVREAETEDAAAIDALMRILDHERRTDDVAAGIARLAADGEPVLVACDETGVIGCVTWHVTPNLHRPKPVGRITLLAVAETAQGKGAGRALVDAVDERCRALGCGMVEVTSNRRLEPAHAFYRHLGFTETSRRFSRPLDES